MGLNLYSLLFNFLSKKLSNLSFTLSVIRQSFINSIFKQLKPIMEKVYVVIFQGGNIRELSPEEAQASMG